MVVAGCPAGAVTALTAATLYDDDGLPGSGELATTPSVGTSAEEEKARRSHSRVPTLSTDAASSTNDSMDAAHACCLPSTPCGCSQVRAVDHMPRGVMERADAMGPNFDMILEKLVVDSGRESLTSRRRKGTGGADGLM
jgi:hypothetical protein